MAGGQVRYVLFVVAATALYGLGNVLMKLAYEGVGPLWCAALRFAIAALLFGGIFGRRMLPVLWRAPLSAWLPAALCMTCSFVSASLSVNYTTATTAGFFFALPMLFTPLLGLLVSRRRFGLGTVLLQAVVIAGLYLLCCGGGQLSFGLGELMGLSASAFYAGALVGIERGLQRMDAFSLTFTQLGVAFVVSLVLALAFEPAPVFASAPVSALAAVVALGVLSTCLAFYLQNIALERVAPTTAAVVTCTEPIFTAVLAFAVLGETLSPVGLVGAAIIVVCTVASSAMDVDAAFRRLVGKVLVMP